ncbi:helix-turn-helix domain-containing protein [Metabacillus arenae]|uniref:Helix-turn-helix transcriptional regulator n=1 Tax=Metabacillus arenae TaxID=2771434 RepID=A0A926RUZ8_9BACI|nr:helix-turn-helix transcriptional regulator [Metabacillus arenae]MBD1379128.1 helix-turn-helix transcriptional regulator [Metabacillus arenae]
MGRCKLDKVLDCKDIELEELSSLTGISVYNLKQYINNDTKMSLKTAKRIAYVLDVHIEELYEKYK